MNTKSEVYGLVSENVWFGAGLNTELSQERRQHYVFMSCGHLMIIGGVVLSIKVSERSQTVP
jgi:hypothetical protein